MRYRVTLNGEFTVIVDHAASDHAAINQALIFARKRHYMPHVASITCNVITPDTVNYRTEVSS
jgi:hypothetical protein